MGAECCHLSIYDETCKTSTTLSNIDKQSIQFGADDILLLLLCIIIIPYKIIQIEEMVNRIYSWLIEPKIFECNVLCHMRIIKMYNVQIYMYI